MDYSKIIALAGDTEVQISVVSCNQNPADHVNKAPPWRGVPATVPSRPLTAFGGATNPVESMTATLVQANARPGPAIAVLLPIFA